MSNAAGLDIHAPLAEMLCFIIQLVCS